MAVTHFPINVQLPPAGMKVSGDKASVLLQFVPPALNTAPGTRWAWHSVNVLKWIHYFSYAVIPQIFSLCCLQKTVLELGPLGGNLMEWYMLRPFLLMLPKPLGVGAPGTSSRCVGEVKTDSQCSSSRSAGTVGPSPTHPKTFPHNQNELCLAGILNHRTGG